MKTLTLVLASMACLVGSASPVYSRSPCEAEIKARMAPIIATIGPDTMSRPGDHHVWLAVIRMDLESRCVVLELPPPRTLDRTVVEEPPAEPQKARPLSPAVRWHLGRQLKIPGMFP